MRKHFPIYSSWRTNIEKLSTEEKALLLDKLMDFYFDGSITDVPAEMIRLDIFWDSIFPFIYENQEKYLNTAENRSNNMAKARQSNPKLQSNKNVDTRPAGIPIPTKRVSNDNVNVNDNVNDNDNENANANANANANDKVIMEEIRKGRTLETLKQMFPHSSSLVDLYFEYDT